MIYLKVREEKNVMHVVLADLQPAVPFISFCRTLLE